MSELIQKKDIQIFFKGIIYEIIKKIEMSNTFGKLLFDPDEIFKAIYKGKISIIDKKEIRDDLIKKYKLFDEIYTFPLTDKDLAIKMSECKDIEIENFLKKKILDCKSDPKLYSNDSLFDKMYKKADPLNVLECYKHSFVQIMDIIDQILENLLINSESLPYSIKCICKIISILIKKKFPKSDKIFQNSFIARFFFNTLFFIIFDNPSLYTLTNEYLISSKTIDKIRVMQKVLNKFISGNFYENFENLVTFNKYFIENMPKLLKFFNNICQVTLPNFIDKFLNDKLPEDYV